MPNVEVESTLVPAEALRALDEIAVIVPVYMGKSMLRELCGRLVKTLQTITNEFSIILVDDRSEDNAWPLIQELGR